MNRPPSFPARLRGMSIIEILITCAVVAITGVLMFNMLYMGMIQFAKNSAINLAHQEARVAVMQMEQDLHAAVSIPELIDTSMPPNLISGVGPAPGIHFQLYSGGPFQVTPGNQLPTPTYPPNTCGYATSATSIVINTNGYVPAANQRLIIPMYQTEINIQSSTTAGNTSTLTLATPLPFTVETTQAGFVMNISCFISDYVSYVVVGTQLIYYPRQSTNANSKVMANDLTSPTPFSIPATALGAPYYRFVAAINLVTADNAYGNMHFKAANMFLNAMEPYRARLCVYQ